MAITMRGADATNGKCGECYVTLDDGRRLNFMSLIDLEATVEKNKTEIPILGRMAKGTKATGWTGSGSITAHYNTSVFRQALAKFKKTGEDFYFEIQATISDPTSSVGTQTTILKNCNLDNTIIAKLEASNDDYMEDSFDFTFDDWEMPEAFADLDGME